MGWHQLWVLSKNGGDYRNCDSGVFLIGFIRLNWPGSRAWPNWPYKAPLCQTQEGVMGVFDLWKDFLKEKVITT